MIECRDDATYVNGKKVLTDWKFVSDGTWYDKGEVCKLETDCGWAGGCFRGMRTSEDDNELTPKGERYEDGELCMWEEFDIYDETGTLLSKATCDGNDTTLIGLQRMII